MNHYDSSMKHVIKVEDLLEMINNDFKKRVMNPDNDKDLDLTTNFITQLKHYSNLYTICLLEICHELQFIGLDFFPRAVFKLFQSFKIHSSYFFKLHIKFFIKNKLDGIESSPIKGFFN